MKVIEYGSEFYIEKNWQEKKIMNNLVNSDYSFFRSGREALHAIAKTANKGDRILLPSFLCESMIIPFELEELEIVYYPINNSLKADLNFIHNYKNNVQFFLYMRYFGVSSLSAQELCDIKNNFPQCIFIEDRTQCGLDKITNDFIPDYRITSLRKWFPLIDGACLWTKKNIIFNYSNELTQFSKIRNGAMEKKYDYLISGDISKKQEYLKELGRAVEIIDHDNHIFMMSDLAKEQLKRINISEVIEKRKVNYSIYKVHLKEISTIIEESDEHVPLYFPILVSNQSLIQKKLAQCNIYCPIIWPLPERVIYPEEFVIHEQILALPCDQRYNPSDIEKICLTLLKILEENQ